MTDSLDGLARSALMSRVRQKHTAPEMTVRRALHAAGLRYVLHPKSLPGRPDLVFPRFGVALFVHGCFWHGHDCRAGRLPSTNAEFWRAKIEGNRQRDARKAADLKSRGWRVLCVWECETKAKDFAGMASILVRSVKESAANDSSSSSDENGSSAA